MKRQAKQRNLIKKFFIILPILIVTMIGLLGCVQDTNGDNNAKISVQTISATQGKAMIDDGNVIIVDVRTKSEYDQGHIKDAILLPNKTIENDALSVLTDLKATIIVYCRSGNRSAQAAEKLVALGYESVYDMGGIQAWQNNGYEIDK